MYETILGLLGTAFFGIIGWTIQLGTRVKVLETQREDLILLLNTKFDDVSGRLGRIEQFLNGHLKGEH